MLLPLTGMLAPLTATPPPQQDELPGQVLPESVVAWADGLTAWYSAGYGVTTDVLGNPSGAHVMRWDPKLWMLRDENNQPADPPRYVGDPTVWEEPTP